MSNYLQLPSFNLFPNLVHAVSLKSAGSLRVKDLQEKNERLESFLAQHEISISDCVAMNQVHGNNVSVVCDKDRGQVISQTDGLVTREINIFLIVQTADCYPVMFFDPVKYIVGIAHLGWKSVYKGLAGKMIEKMVKWGAEKENIVVGIGPGIGSCCYDVDEERVCKFQGKLGNEFKFYYKRKGKYYLDLLSIIRQDLVNLKIKEEKVTSLNMCTSCHSNEFFSYRADCKKFGSSQGQFLTVVGMRRD